MFNAGDKVVYNKYGATKVRTVLCVTPDGVWFAWTIHPDGCTSTWVKQNDYRRVA